MPQGWSGTRVKVSEVRLAALDPSTGVAPIESRYAGASPNATVRVSGTASTTAPSGDRTWSLGPPDIPLSTTSRQFPNASAASKSATAVAVLPTANDTRSEAGSSRTSRSGAPPLPRQTQRDGRLDDDQERQLQPKRPAGPRQDSIEPDRGAVSRKRQKTGVQLGAAP